jgi:hypothetical protein
VQLHVAAGVGHGYARGQLAEVDEVVLLVEGTLGRGAAIYPADVCNVALAEALDSRAFSEHKVLGALPRALRRWKSSQVDQVLPRGGVVRKHAVHDVLSSSLLPGCSAAPSACPLLFDRRVEAISDRSLLDQHATAPRL